MLENPGRGKRYFKDGRFVKQDKIPLDVLSRLEPGKDVPDATEALDPTTKLCVFCGMGTNINRMVNGQIVYLCEQHYYDSNIGQIAQRVRELEEAKKVLK